MAQIPHPAPHLDLRAVDAWLGPRLVFQDLDLILKTGEPTVILGAQGRRQECPDQAAQPRNLPGGESQLLATDLCQQRAAPADTARCCRPMQPAERTEARD
jgi:hypothetical protein